LILELKLFKEDIDYMNDFLQSLRNGKTENQRIPMTRKTYHNVYHQTNPRFHPNNGYPSNGNLSMKRSSTHNQSRNQISKDEAAPSVLIQALDTLNRHIEILSKNQDYLVSAQERTADMLERQAIAMERIVDHLNIFPKQSSSLRILKKQSGTANKTDTTIADPVEDLTPDKPVVLKRKKNVKKNDAKENSSITKRLGRDEIMGIIHQMRKEGAIFDQIAKRLIALGQPTFSGRGEWHAQTIHRLCSR